METKLPNSNLQFSISIFLTCLFIFTIFTSETASAAKKAAILIGIDKYVEASQIPILRYAESDANKMTKILSQNGYECQTFVNENATREHLTEAFIQLEQQTGQTDGELDVFLGYFSGRGTRLPDDINADETIDAFDECLLPYDAVADNPRSYLRDDVLGRWLNSIKAKQVILIVDMSFWGDENNPNVKGLGKMPEAAALDGIEIADGLPPNAIILSAALPNNVAIDGVFATKLLESCVTESADQSGDRIISFAEAYQYAHGQMPGELNAEGIWKLIAYQYAHGRMPGRNAPEPVGAKAAVDILLAPLPPLSRFQIESKPPEAEIRLEGRGAVATRQLDQPQQTPATIPLKHGTYKVWVQKPGFLIPEAKEVTIDKYETLYPVEPFQLKAISVEGQTNIVNMAGEPFVIDNGKLTLHVKHANKEIHQEMLPTDGRFRLNPETHQWLAVGAEYELQVTGQPVLSVKPAPFTYDGYSDLRTALTVTIDDIPPKLSPNGLALQSTRLVVGEEFWGSIKASDEGLGLADAIEIQLQPPDDQKPISVPVSNVRFQAPDSYEFRYTLPQNPDLAGTWSLLALRLQDKAGNITRLSADQLKATFLVFASRFLLGKYYFEARDYAESLNHFKQVSPPTDEARYWAALAYYQQGNLAQAMEEFQKVEVKTNYLGSSSKKDIPSIPRRLVSKFWGQLLDNLDAHRADAEYMSLLAATAEELGRSYEAKVYGEYAKQLRETPTKRSSKL